MSIADLGSDYTLTTLMEADIAVNPIPRPSFSRSGHF